MSIPRTWRRTSRAIWNDLDGILVPGGFGARGMEGKINAITYARENKIPYFGICLGMQFAVDRVREALGKLTGPTALSSIEETDAPSSTSWGNGSTGRACVQKGTLHR